MNKELTVVSSTEDTWPATGSAIVRAFGQTKLETGHNRDSLRPLSRRLSLRRGSEIIGGCFAYDLNISLPGSGSIPAAGLAGVGILPTAQGLGGFKHLIQRHLTNSVEHGDGLSVLLASESGLYSRFGYGKATEVAEYKLHTREFGLLENPQDAGHVELVEDIDEARRLCAHVHAGQAVAGDLQRSAGWWEQVIHEGERSWLGGGEQFIAIHRDADGEADAYALYVLEVIQEGPGFGEGNQNNRLVLREFVALTLVAEQSLFSFLCRIARVRELHWLMAPVDPSLQYFLRDPRQLIQVARMDLLWMRILDLEKILTSRVYTCDGEVTFEYNDKQLPENSGKYCLKVDAGEASLHRISESESAELTIGPSEMATTVMGQSRVNFLYSLGKITGEHSAMRVLDRLFITDRPPFNLSKF